MISAPCRNRIAAVAARARKAWAVLALVAVLPAFAANVSARETGFRIGARDVLHLVIFAGGEKLHEVDLTVGEEGRVTVPFVGPIPAAGATLSELERRIYEPLAAEYFVDPEILLTIREYRSLRYYISGAVESPGLYETETPATLMKLLAKAGGVLPNRGNVAYVLREATDTVDDGTDMDSLVRERAPERVDLVRLLDRGDMGENRTLQSGDVVYIPLRKELPVAESSIYVEGEVKNPGVYPYQPGISALNACLMAGGFGRYAAPNRAKVIRKAGDEQVVIRVDLEAVREGRVRDLELKPGDLINVPESWL